MNEPPEIDGIFRDLEELDHEPAASESEIEVAARIAARLGGAGWFGHSFSSDRGSAGEVSLSRSIQEKQSSEVVETPSAIVSETEAGHAADIPFPIWSLRLREGDPAVVQSLWDLFFSRLVEVADAQLREAAGTEPLRVDAEDIAADALHDLWHEAKAGHLPDFREQKEVWQLLVELVRRGTLDVIMARHRIGCDSTEPSELEQQSRGVSRFASPELRPIQSHRYEAFFDGLEDPRQREIAKLRLEGYSVREIGERLGLLSPTVQRKLRLIREAWDWWRGNQPIDRSADLPEAFPELMASNEAEPVWLKSVYAQLLKVAERALASEKPGHSLQPTLLANDACLKLIGQRNLETATRNELVAAGAKIIRMLLVDYARKRNAAKRGGRKLSLDMEVPAAGSPVDVSLVHERLEMLAQTHARAAAVGELIFFGGMSVADVAKFLRVSPRTISADWECARGWLGRFRIS